jgi:acid phosphatase
MLFPRSLLTEMRRTRFLIPLSAFHYICVAAIFLLAQSSSGLPIALAPSNLNADVQRLLPLSHPNALPYIKGGWSSRFDPNVWEGKISEISTQEESDDGAWNLLYHLGGNGPWIQRVDDVVKSERDIFSIATPPGCRVQQVHMLSRHAERYPTINAGIRMLDLVERIKTSNITIKGDLGFLNTWEYFADGDPSGKFEQLTSTGPYAGTLEAFTTGVKLRTRYADLFANRFPPGGGKTSLWASASQRVVDTGRYFSAGFFGINWNDTAELHVIPETAVRGGDTLTPGHSCQAYLNDTTKGHNQGNAKLVEFRATYIPTIASRLEEQLGSPNFHFTNDEIYAMQEMCGFEILVRGSSPWCSIFTQSEWRAFEYARDVLHYYRSGPGSRYGVPMGSLWLRATAELLQQGEKAGPFFFSFTHDSDLAAMLATLGLFPRVPILPVNGRIPGDQKWKMSQTLPMGGRIILERLTCRQRQNGSEEERGSEKVYVRINVNDGIVPYRGCTTGPGSSCPLDLFLRRIEKWSARGGSFKDVCGLSKDAPVSISFLHQ